MPGGIKCQKLGVMALLCIAQKPDLKMTELLRDYHLEQNNSRFIQRTGKAMKYVSGADDWIA